MGVPKGGVILTRAKPAVSSGISSGPEHERKTEKMISMNKTVSDFNVPPHFCMCGRITISIYMRVLGQVQGEIKKTGFRNAAAGEIARVLSCFSAYKASRS